MNDRFPNSRRFGEVTDYKRGQTTTGETSLTMKLLIVGLIWEEADTLAQHG